MPGLHRLLLIATWIAGFWWGPTGFFLAGAVLLAVEALLWRLDMVELPRLRLRWRELHHSVRLGEVPSYDAIRHAIDTGAHSGREFDFGLRRHLQRIAAARLADKRGVDLHREPEAARDALGEQLWWLVDRQRPVSREHVGGGVPPPELARYVDRLERL
jgi:hypothetical protein